MIGVLVADSNTSNFFTEDGVRVAQLLAQQMAIALENARLYQDALQAGEKRAILHRASQEIAHASQDPEQVYKAVHRAAVELMPAEAFVITLLDEQNQETVGVYLVDKGGRWQSDRAPAGAGLSGLVTSTGKPVITHDLTGGTNSRKCTFWRRRRGQVYPRGSFATGRKSDRDVVSSKLQAICLFRGRQNLTGITGGSCRCRDRKCTPLRRNLASLE